MLNAALSSSVTLSNANLNYFIPVGTTPAVGTIASASGKWYWETVPTSGNQLTAIGVASVDAVRNNKNYSSTTSANPIMAYEPISGSVYVNGLIVTTTTTSAANDTVAIAYDAGANTAAIYKNNTLLYTATLTGTSSGAMPYLANPSGSQAAVGYINFGQRPFSYTPPTGFNALNTYNLPTPTIANGAQYMAATTYTGTGATQTINDGTNTAIGTTFQPDFVWLKSRSAATDHALYDVVRGTTLDLASNTAAAETTQSTGLTAFGSTGFTIGALAKINTNAATYVAWQWKAGGTALSNTAGSITSSVSANPTAGFSVVTFTAPASGNFTVGHGLNASPAMMILKDRSAVVSWVVWHKSLSNPAQSYLSISNTNGAGANTTVWGNTAPTSTVMTLGVGGAMNASDATVAYCFSEVAGYSAFGSYTGNGSSDGVFIYTGFRPRFFMWKRTDTTGNWDIMDTSRDTYNLTGNQLFPNLSNAELAGGVGDMLSNGFKFRDGSSGNNASGGTYIYAAFAENPFALARAR